jgi:ribonuclease HI
MHEPYVPLKLLSDSKLVVKCLAELVRKWEDIGYIGVAHEQIWRPIVALLRQRGAPFAIRKVKAHTGIEGNGGADAQALAGAQKNDSDEIDLSVPEAFMSEAQN